MIRRLKYNEIDFIKYSQCLENSEQRKYSATKDFLDISSKKQWEILVYKDYEAVMPIPFIKKFGIKFVINPKLCQQLGIFSPKENKELNDLFLQFFREKYNIWYYAFNDENKFTEELKSKKNFLMYPEKYEVVRQRYSPKRKRKLRLDDEVLLDSQVKEVRMADAQGFISESLIGAKDDGDKKSFLEIFNALENSGRLKVMAFIYKSKIINVIAMYFDERTVALLGSFNDKDYVKLSGASVLIDNMIKETIETHIFDFEGGDLPNMDEFFRGFRPELKPYTVIQNSKKDLLKHLRFF
ncbi:hypothetical protein [Chryseobacterium sp. PMSZPI]|uniref:hypothetical protein n=1 Tax=Chryseobacterium sp. PMSZPI TaxID=1033900 RepID=UPI000C33F854|nr:hypothetical protein [Chryseobacterium sp. PMSZPI]PKF76163.1 hypothetical protein CW752_00825 [Chryseobacterium sp. PMSZPI]